MGDWSKVLKRWAWWEPIDGSKSATMWNSGCLRHWAQEPGCQIRLLAYSGPLPAAASLPRDDGSQHPEAQHHMLCFRYGKGFRERAEAGLVSCFLLSSTFFCLLSSSLFYWSLFSNTHTGILATCPFREAESFRRTLLGSPHLSTRCMRSLHMDAYHKGSRRPAESGETIYSKLGYQVQGV